MVYIIGESCPVEVGGDIIGRINVDKKNFIMNGDKMGLSACRIILGEIQRDPNKNYTDENVTKILRGLRKMTLKNPVPDTLLIALIDTYIPGPVSDVELYAWMSSSGFADHKIKEMGKKAYSIIGMAKKFFGDREINSDGLKGHIDGVLETGE